MADGTNFKIIKYVDNNMVSLYPETVSSNVKVGDSDLDTELTNIKNSINNSSSSLPIGSVIIWDSGNDIPDGWLELNGQSLSRTLYSELFTHYKTQMKYSSFASTFNLPSIDSSSLSTTGVTFIFIVKAK